MYPSPQKNNNNLHINYNAVWKEVEDVATKRVKANRFDMIIMNVNFFQSYILPHPPTCQKLER